MITSRQILALSAKTVLLAEPSAATGTGFPTIAEFISIQIDCSLAATQLEFSYVFSRHNQKLQPNFTSEEISS